MRPRTEPKASVALSFPVMFTPHLDKQPMTGALSCGGATGTELAGTPMGLQSLFSKEGRHETRETCCSRNFHNRDPCRGRLGRFAHQGGYGLLQHEGGTNEQGESGAARNGGDDAAAGALVDATGDACVAGDRRSVGSGNGQRSARQQSNGWEDNGQ